MADPRAPRASKEALLMTSDTCEDDEGSEEPQSMSADAAECVSECQLAAEVRA